MTAESSIKAGWQDAFRLRDDLLQPEVYAFEKALQKHGGIAGAIMGGGTVQASHALYAAIDAGWIAEPEAVAGESVDQDGKKVARYFIGGKGVHEMTAGMVVWYGSQVVTAYRGATEIPPN